MNIKQLRTQQWKFYKKLKPMYCPVLCDDVFFTANGFTHLIYNSNRKPRPIKEQWLKLKCLDYVPEVISKCKGMTDVRNYEEEKDGKIRKYTHYELKCNVRSKDKKRYKIQVIIERLGTGKYKFKSVMKL
jgi:hypothetical protein